MPDGNGVDDDGNGDYHGNGVDDDGNGDDHGVVKKDDCDGDCRAVTIAGLNFRYVVQRAEMS